MQKHPSEVPEFVEVVIEVPKGSTVKRRPDGTVDFVTPLPCPFNYGSVHSIPAPDGDPLDAIVLGEYLPYGHKGTWKVKGLLKFIDAGVVDNKLVCVQPSKICKPCFKGSKRESFKAIGGPRVLAAHDFEETIENGLNEDISLMDWFSLSCIFSGYSVFKGGLNFARGKHGSTSFNGWEIYG